MAKKPEAFFTTSGIERSSMEESSSVKVGMHVLGIGKTDGRVMRAATALVEDGYSVFLIDIASKDAPQLEENIRGVCLKHVAVSDSFLSTRFDRWAFVRIVYVFVSSLLNLLKVQADIYHAHDISALPACYIAAFLLRKPIIFETHEMPLFERPLAEMGLSRRWLYKLLHIFLSYVLPRCAGIITVSPPIVEELRSRYHVPAITLVRSVPEYRSVSKNDRLRQLLGLRPESRIALYQGYLQADRGLDKLVRAAPFLEEDIVIVMMGKSSGAMQSQLEALIESEGVAERIKILPAVPYEELLDWTTSADIGLNVASPDYSLNVRFFLPNKLFEYLMAGLPVLSSPLEAIVDIIETYDVGKVLPSLLPLDIGSSINMMLANPVDLARQRNNALEVARREFYWEKERLHLIHLYQSILTDKSY